MSEMKPWEILLPAIAAVAAPFVAPALFGATAAADVGAGAAGLGAGEAAAAGIPSADALLAAAPTAAGTIAESATPLAAGSAALAAPTEAAITGLGEAGAAFPAAATALGQALGPTAAATAPGALPSADALLAAPATTVAPTASGIAAPVGGAGISAAGSAAPASITLGPESMGSGITDAFTGTITGDAGAAGATSGLSPLETQVAAAGAINPQYGTLVGETPLGQSAADAAVAGSTVPSAAPEAAGGGGLGGMLSAAKPYLPYAGLALSGGGMLYNMLNQPKYPSVQSEIGPLQTAASNLGSQGTALAGYLQSGTLPPGVQQSINMGRDQAKAAVRAKYAAMGGGAETSSAAIEDMAAIDQRASAQGSQIALQLLSQGVSEQELSSGLYQSLLQTTLSQSAATGQALSNFASSLVPRTYIPAAPA